MKDGLWWVSVCGDAEDQKYTVLGIWRTCILVRYRCISIIFLLERTSDVVRYLPYVPYLKSWHLPWHLDTLAYVSNAPSATGANA